MEQELLLRIILQNPPPGVDFGLQQGKGHLHHPVQIQRSGAQDLVFTCTIRLKNADQKANPPSLQGPFVQGPASGRFLYIDIGTAAGQTDTPWSRRLKIPLTIDWALIDQLIASPQHLLETVVPGTGKDGGPNCATVKPFAGWHLAPA